MRLWPIVLLGSLAALGAGAWLWAQDEPPPPR